MLTRKEAIIAQFMSCKEFVGNSEDALIMIVNAVSEYPQIVREYQKEATKVDLEF